MRHKLLNVIPVALLLVLRLHAQSVGPPSLGIIFNSAAGAIQRISGVPGAAYLGTPLLTDLTSASISPNGKSAVISRGSHVALVDGLDLTVAAATRDTSTAGRGGLSSTTAEAAMRMHAIRAAPREAVLDGITAPYLAAWSDTSEYLAVLSATQVIMFKHGPAGFALVSSVASELPAGIPKSAALSLSPDVLYVAIESQDGGGIYSVNCSDGTARLLVGLSKPGSMLLLRGEIWAVDELGSTVVRIRADGNGIARPLALDGASANAIAGLAASSDGASIFLFARTVNKAWIYDAAQDQIAAEVPLDFASASVQRAGGSPLVLITDRGSSLLSAVDPDQRTAFFIPAPSAPATPEEK